MMIESKKLKVLILPDLFPKNEKDWVGVFIVDYIKSILPNTAPWVFYSRLIGNYQIVTKEKFDNTFDVYRWSYKKQLSSILKPFYYFLWFGRTVNKIESQERKIDLIHAHGAILNGTVAYFLGRKLKVPFIISEHTGPFSKISNSFIKKRWAKFILNRADKVFAVSKHLKNEIVSMGVLSSKIEVSFNPVDTNLFKIINKINTNKNILFVSRLEPFKGGLRTLKAFHQFMSNMNDWNLTICGEGQEKEDILAFIHQHELQNRVTLKGVLTKSEYVEELNEASFLVFPSEHESFGLIPVEAMTCGLPVITMDATAMPEYINEQNGILLKTSSTEELSEAMLNMAQNFSKYDSKAISEEMIERFGLQNFGKMLLMHYKSVMNNYKN